MIDNKNEIEETDELVEISANIIVITILIIVIMLFWMNSDYLLRSNFYLLTFIVPAIIGLYSIIRWHRIIRYISKKINNIVNN